ncbi:MAG: hypothetical protein H0W62_09760 [Chitinophagales bacterium]|nr:hypothetical protein [Chitinophagales bacterium]
MRLQLPLLIAIFSLLHLTQMYAQERPLIQYSGIVMSIDTNHIPVSFASVYNRSINIGTIANYEGFFSFAAHIGDTIEISSVGYRKGIVIVPEIPNNQSFTALIFLKKEVQTLPETSVYPWFSKDQFRDAFVHMNIPDDDLERARKNLDPNRLGELAANLRDPNINAGKVLSDNSYTYYYQGQVRPQPILSPLAWLQFFNMLKSGSLKKQ